jgi:hypothetical protein
MRRQLGSGVDALEAGGTDRINIVEEKFNTHIYKNKILSV